MVHWPKYNDKNKKETKQSQFKIKSCSIAQLKFNVTKFARQGSSARKNMGAF